MSLWSPSWWDFATYCAEALAVVAGCGGVAWLILDRTGRKAQQ